MVGRQAMFCQRRRVELGKLGVFNALGRKAWLCPRRGAEAGKPACRSDPNGQIALEQLPSHDALIPCSKQRGINLAEYCQKKA